jgi:hypothetical protein
MDALDLSSVAKEILEQVLKEHYDTAFGQPFPEHLREHIEVTFGKKYAKLVTNKSIERRH